MPPPLVQDQCVGSGPAFNRMTGCLIKSLTLYQGLARGLGVLGRKIGASEWGPLHLVCTWARRGTALRGSRAWGSPADLVWGAPSQARSWPLFPSRLAPAEKEKGLPGEGGAVGVVTWLRTGTQRPLGGDEPSPKGVTRPVYIGHHCSPSLGVGWRWLGGRQCLGTLGTTGGRAAAPVRAMGTLERWGLPPWALAILLLALAAHAAGELTYLWRDVETQEWLRCRRCPPGTFVQRPCRRDSPTMCGACPPRHYTQFWNYLERCRYCNVICGEREEEARPCQATHNRACRCRPGFFAHAGFCLEHAPCPPGTGVAVPGGQQGWRGGVATQGICCHGGQQPSFP